MQAKKIIIASDHAGCPAKAIVASYLTEHGHIIHDCGVHDATVSVDYPDKAVDLVKSFVDNQADMAILLCGSGIGMSIAVNRYSFIRGALCCSAEMARLARAHNDANVLVLGGRLTEEKTLIECVDAFLTTQFEGGRHIARVEKLGKLPNEL